MAELDDMATEKLTEAKLPTNFSYRQAFIAGYNARKALEFRVLWGGRPRLDPLDNRDPMALGYLKLKEEGLDDTNRNAGQGSTAGK